MRVRLGPYRKNDAISLPRAVKVEIEPPKETADE